ncbi:MAG: DUF6056 family protein [Anaerolineales bacterium]
MKIPIIGRIDLSQLVFLIAAFAVVVPLLAFGLNGSYMRYSGDDYCYAGYFSQFGLIGSVWNSYLGSSPFHGNRFSLTSFSGLADAIGPSANAVLPALALVLWVGSLTYAIRVGMRLAGYSAKRWIPFMVAAFLVFQTLYQAPDLRQSLYWRSGMLPYLAPLIANTILIAIMLRVIGRSRVSYIGNVMIGIGALIAGGFSETAAMLQLGVMLLGVAIAWWGMRLGKPWSKSGFRVFSAAAIGTLAGITLLIVSPSNATRLETYPSPPDLITLFMAVTRRARNFIIGSIAGLPVPNFVAFSFVSALSALMGLRREIGIFDRSRKLIVALMVILLLGYGLTALTLSASSYATLGSPNPRALITSRFVLVLMVAGMGWLAGSLATRLVKRSGNYPRFAVAASSLALLVLSAYPVYATASILEDTRELRNWSAQWDKRDREIVAARDSGQSQVEVAQLDHPIPWVGELQPDPGFWYNQCAATYYDLVEIRAVLPSSD